MVGEVGEKGGGIWLGGEKEEGGGGGNGETSGQLAKDAAWQVPVSMGGMMGFHQRLLNVKSYLRE